MSWEKVRLGDVIEILSGFAFDSKKFHESQGMPLIRIRDIKRSYSETFYNGQFDDKFIIKKGDIIIGMDGEFNISDWKGVDSLLNQRVCKINNYKKDKIDKRYLLHFLPIELKLIEDKTSFVTVKHLSIKDINEIEIPLPPLATQKRIADILDTADALRRKDRELLTKYDQLAQAIFIDMFGDPVKNEKGWEVKRLGAHIDSIRYGTGSPPEYSTFGIPFIRATNIKKGTVVEKGMVYLSDIEAQKIKKCFIKEGDLIIVRSGANTGDCAYIPAKYNGSLGGYDLIVEMDKIKSRFYNYIINSIWGKSIIEKLSRRAGQPHLNSEQVSNMELISPDYVHLQKFKKSLDAIDELKINIEKIATKNSSLFSSLLQQAFNGILVS